MPYVYRHIRLDTNEVFYIGIGKNLRRAFSSKNRNLHWHHIVNITKYEVDIIFEHNNYEFIRGKEIEFIKLYGRRDLGKGTLVNLTDGGEGTLNYLHRGGEKNPMYGKSNVAVLGDKNPMRRPEVIEKFKGTNNSMYGVTPSEKCGLPKIPITMNHSTLGVRDFTSIREAARFLKYNGYDKVDHSSIAKCIKNKRHMAYSATWTKNLVPTQSVTDLAR